MFKDNKDSSSEAKEPESGITVQGHVEKYITPRYYQLREEHVSKPSKSIDEIMAEVDQMDGLEFERWCADLLRTLHYENVENTVASGDQGVDIIAKKNGKRYAIQCKRYNSWLGNTPVQEVYAGKKYYDCDVAVVMTNSRFTASARELAEATHVRLWDMYTIKKMLRYSEKNDPENFSKKF